MFPPLPPFPISLLGLFSFHSFAQLSLLLYRHLDFSFIASSLSFSFSFQRVTGLLGLNVSRSENLHFQCEIFSDYWREKYSCSNVYRDLLRCYNNTFVEFETNLRLCKNHNSEESQVFERSQYILLTLCSGLLTNFLAFGKISKLLW